MISCIKINDIKRFIMTSRVYRLIGQKVCDTDLSGLPVDLESL